MLLLPKCLSFILFAFLQSATPAELTHISVANDTYLSFDSDTVKLQKPRYSKARQSRAKKKAIVEKKLRDGCVKPDAKKIAAAKAAELKYKSKPKR